MMVDVYLFRVATGEIVQRVVGEADAVHAMTDDAISGVPYVMGTSDSTHRVDLATLQVVPR